MELLQKANPFIIKNASLSHIAQDCCDKYRYFLERCDTISDSSMAYPLWTEFTGAFWILDSILATDYSVSKYTDLTEEDYWKALDYSKQSDVIVERFGYEISTSDVAAFLSEIDTISDFELKCSYTYAMIYYSGFMMASSLESSIKSMLENLLTDGRYSHHLFNMWRVWRAIVQYEYGSSKMSDIANGIYNKMRLKVATTTLNHLINNPDDKVAINQYLMISYHGNTLRNGEYNYGNQSIIDMYYLGLVR